MLCNVGHNNPGAITFKSRSALSSASNFITSCAAPRRIAVAQGGHLVGHHLLSAAHQMYAIVKGVAIVAIVEGHGKACWL